VACDRTTGEPDPAALEEILRRIVKVAEPERVVMFGSAARGDMGPNSDIDLLVVKAGDYHRGRLTEDIYMSLFGIGRAVDVVVVTPEDVERYRDCHAAVIAPAVAEGRTIHAA
jgi:predicted nucleotidyltransferase